ncbi:unnamed protein product, partial [Arabidopsis halleri]
VINSLIFAVVEMAERFAFYGLASNLITFLSNELGQSTTTAAKTHQHMDRCFLHVPHSRAFLANSILGRFKTVLLTSFIYLLVYISLPNINLDSFFKISN